MHERVNDHFAAHRHQIIDSRFIVLILVSPIAPLMLVGPQTLAVFGELNPISAALLVVSWLGVGYAIAVLVAALGAWLLGARVD